ncbi:MAG: YicC/YloC family endoribonuclease [Chitinophagales bacterium]|nr:YicC family protein [Bacteroidota bacterium]
MIYSMTGFGKDSAWINGKKVSIEIKSLNSKTLDVNLRLPAYYKSMEFALRKEISEHLKRGKIDVNIQVEFEENAYQFKLNTSLVNAYVHALREVAQNHDLSQQDILAILGRNPDIFINTEINDEQEEQALLQLLTQCVVRFNDFRRSEGSVLEDDLLQRIAIMQTLLEKIEKQMPARVVRVKDRLYAQLQANFSNNAYDANRFEQEIIYYLEKLDITEEITRLGSHFKYFVENIQAKTSVEKGKKLNFITQEMGREINTIGAKANDSQMQKWVINLKDELEKIKEQVLNIL